MLISVLKKAVFPFLLFGILAALSGIGPPGSGRAEASPPQAAQEAPLRFGVLYLLSPQRALRALDAVRGIPLPQRPAGRWTSSSRGTSITWSSSRGAASSILSSSILTSISLLKKEIGIEAVAAQVAYGNTFAPSYIVVRKDSRDQGLEDLRGKKIAFVSHLASSGYVVPRAFLMSQGIDVDREMKVVFTKNLPGTLLAVLNRDVDAAGMCGVNYADLSRRIDTEAVEILRTTEVSPRLSLVVRKGLDRGSWRRSRRRRSASRRTRRWGRPQGPQLRRVRTDHRRRIRWDQETGAPDGSPALDRLPVTTASSQFSYRLIPTALAVTGLPAVAAVVPPF